MSARPLLADAPAQAPVRGKAADYLSLTKPRLTTLVLVTTALGYLLAQRSFDLWLFLHTVVGTALVAGAAQTFNQIWEREHDGKMRRTMTRALPSGRIDPLPAALFGITLSAAGLAELAIGVNVLSAVLGALSLALYILVYTPLKRVTSLATVVGAVPGAIPPLIGWAAASGGLSPGAWVLFAVLFFWQMPHFLAIAWLYREDYARGGFPMLPVLEPDGASTGRQAVLYASTLLPVSLALSAVRVTGGAYFAGAALCGAVFAGFAAAFALRRHAASARRLFFASIVYLPVVLLLAILDRRPWP
jgi:protoheme IX farnesyltransferase